MKIAPFLYIGILFFLGGCASEYRFKVDAIKDPEVQFKSGNRFVITPLDENMDRSNLRYLELKTILTKALLQNGYVVVSQGEATDYNLKISSHLSEPILAVRDRLDPVYYETFGNSRIIARPVVNKQGVVVRYTYQQVWIPPQREFAGYVNRSQRITVFDKLLRLSVYQDQDGKSIDVWNLNIYTRSESQDLRGHLPALVTAAMPYFGAQTEGEIEVRLEEDDPQLIYLKTTTTE